MKIGIVGATSKLGGLTAEALTDHEVIALVRSPSKWSGTVRPCDLAKPEQFPQATRELDVIVSVAGAPVSPYPVSPRCTFEAVDRDGHAALAQAAKANGVRRFVYVSVHGDDMDHLHYVTTHRDAERAIEATGLEFCAVRPVGLFGSFEMLLPFAKWGLAFNIAGGSARTNPIAEQDLAAVLAQAATANVIERTISAGGPDILTRREIWELCFAALDRKGVHLPSFQFSLHTAAVMLALIDKRAADVTRFLAHVVCNDEVAPVRGTTRLADHLNQLVKSS